MDKKYLKRVALYVFAAVFSVGMILYIGYHLWNGITSKITTSPALQVSRSFTVRADAYIVMSETPIRASGTGKAFPEVADASHVAAYSTVAGIYSNTDEALRAEITNLQAQLRLLKDYSVAGHSAKEASKTDRRIYDIMTKMKRLVRDNDIGGALGMRSELLCEISEQEGDGLVGREHRLDNLIAECADKREEKPSRHAVRDGHYSVRRMVFSETDGYESVFTPEKIKDLSPSGYDALSAAQGEPTDTDAGKIVTDYKWYVAVKVSAQSVSGMEIGRTYEVSFPYNRGESLEMTLESAVDDETGECVLVLSSGKITSDFSFVRSQTVEITTKVMSGFSVPKSAIRMNDGVIGVYVFDGMTVSFRRIEVIREFDDAYLVSSDVGDASAETGNEGSAQSAPYLSRNEQIITSGKGLYDRAHTVVGSADQSIPRRRNRSAVRRRESTAAQKRRRSAKVRRHVGESVRKSTA